MFWSRYEDKGSFFHLRIAPVLLILSSLLEGQSHKGQEEDASQEEEIQQTRWPLQSFYQAPHFGLSWKT